MLELHKSILNENIVLTLTELVTVVDPIFVFTFIQSTTKQQVTFTKTYADDLSDYPERYNEFETSATLFNTIGEWHYVVTEQQTDNVLEYGKLIVCPETSFEYNINNTPTTYTQYNG